MSHTTRPDQGKIVAVEEDIPSVTIIQAVAEMEETDPTDLPLLSDVVNPDALDDIFEDRTTGSVTFEYHGYTVVVQQNDLVVIRE